MPIGTPQPKFFARSSDLRKWFETHHHSKTELWVGFYRKASGRQSITWPEAVEEALCFGWIDGIRKRVDAISYTNRFTPRKKGSNWSMINIRKVAALRRQGRMTAAGIATFTARNARRTGVYSFEQRQTVAFTPAFAKALRQDKSAWASFQAQPASYRRTATFWVMSAKQEATRARRLVQLIEDHRHGRRIGPLRRQSPVTKRKGQ
jgi:uncharacterized protein YdeI (YjbR/CyaY-like superfamily)